jgi:hypothetical protein
MFNHRSQQRNAIIPGLFQRLAPSIRAGSAWASKTLLAMKTRRKHPRTKAQSFVEFALILPVLLLILLGVVELLFFMFSYADVLILTREAARFASVRDPFETASQGDHDCGTGNSFNFFYDTSCIFSPLAGSVCDDPAFCNGFNNSVPFKSGEDDILITAYTVAQDSVHQVFPSVSDGGVWAWSNNDADTAHNDNWRSSCGHVDPTTVTDDYSLTAEEIETHLRASSRPLKGFVAVEAYYCYYYVLNIPIFTDIVPNPLLIHVYTVMPLPAAQPTPTEIS